jgi:hypothetical protein
MESMILVAAMNFAQGCPLKRGRCVKSASCWGAYAVRVRFGRDSFSRGVGVRFGNFKIYRTSAIFFCTVVFGDGVYGY